DGHSLTYRSYFAFIRRPLRNSKGQNTSAVFGFANTLRKLLEALRPGFCAVVFDAPGKTFRHELYQEYKIQRPPAPEELSEQVPTIKEMVAAWGLARLEVPGVEADDVIGAVASRLNDEKTEVVIATSDKDMLQLVAEHVSVYDPWQEKKYGPDEVVEKMGVGPELVADFLALTGDPVDNVPGIPGIGPKRAKAILERHGTLDRALESEPKLADHRDTALLSRELVAVRTDMEEVKTSVEAFRVREIDKQALRRVFEDMEFGSLLADLAESEDSVSVDVRVTREQRNTGGAGFAFCLREGEGLWFTDDGSRVYRVPWTDRGVLGSYLAGEVLKSGFGVKGQIRKAWSNGLRIGQPLFDVGVGAWLVGPNRRRYWLPDIVRSVLGRPFAEPKPEYEAVLVFELHRRLAPLIAAMGLDPVCEEMEMPLIPVLARMEDRGVRVDTGLLESIRKELLHKRELAERAIWDIAGVEFNIASPKQLGGVLFDRLGLPKGRRTKTGYSTSSAVLERLQSRHPVVDLVLEYRELAKLIGTYIEPLLQQADPQTQRVHPEFNQTGTATGRLSATNPNIQNIPIRSDVGRSLRRAFVAEPGSVLLSADYSQIELRVLAHVSGDEELKKAFEAGEDVHASTAAAVFGLEPQAVTTEHRRLAKVVNYGLLYGMSGFGLSSRMKIPVDQARAFLADYMRHFAGVAEWRDRTLEQARTDGQVRTLAGRIRPVPEVVSRNRNVAEAAERAALNAPIQGTAADIIKRAMLDVDDALENAGIGGGMVAQIHDELLFEIPEDQSERAEAVVRQTMQNAWGLDVPLVVGIGCGKNWSEAHG
ncbi:MAG: DNA polymerase I, partial [candidate division WOR-3 bacterium]